MSDDTLIFNNDSIYFCICKKRRLRAWIAAKDVPFLLLDFEFSKS